MRPRSMAAVLVVVWAAASVSAAEPAVPQAEYRLVRFGGVTMVVLPFDLPEYPFCVVYPLPPAVPMRPGMLYQVLIPAREDGVRAAFPEEIVLVYRRDDPVQLAFEVRGCCLLMNGKPVMLLRGEDGSAVAWLSSAPESDLKSLRNVALSPEMLLWGADALDRLAKHNPHVALVLVGEPDKPKSERADEDERQWIARAVKAVSKFRPHLLCLPPEILASPDLAPAVFRDAQWLLLGSSSIGSDEAAVLLKRVHESVSLRHLVLGCGMPPFEWHRFRELRSLVLHHVEAPADLGPLAALPNLERLAIAHAEDVDLAPLAKSPNLKVLNLVRSERLRNLDRLDDVHLTWFTAPSDITTDQLSGFLRQHPELQVLAFYKNKDLNLEPLTHVAGLRVLVLATEVEDLDPVVSLKRLELLVLHNEHWKDGAYWPVTLHRERPDMEIAFVGGLCLGSGWILLLIPAAALAAWLTRAKRAGSFRSAAHGSPS